MPGDEEPIHVNCLDRLGFVVSHRTLVEGVIWPMFNVDYPSVAREIGAPQEEEEEYSDDYSENTEISD